MVEVVKRNETKNLGCLIEGAITGSLSLGIKKVEVEFVEFYLDDKKLTDLFIDVLITEEIGGTRLSEKKAEIIRGKVMLIVGKYPDLRGKWAKAKINVNVGWPTQEVRIAR